MRKRHIGDIYRTVFPKPKPRMHQRPARIIPVLLLLPVLLQSGCAIHKKATVGASAIMLQEVAKASSKQSDLKIVREAMPSYLLLMDGMVEGWPDNPKILLGAAQGYSSYASAFTSDEDRDHAAVLFARAKRYALKAVELRGLKDPAGCPFDEFEKRLDRFGKKDVPYLFWAAACWGSWINQNLDSMEAMAELPRVERMMRKALELDESFYFGGPHLFMGIWYASRPPVAGGDLVTAKEHFLKAVEIGNGRFLMARVLYAEHYAKRAFDKDLYVSILKQVVEAPADVPPELTLLNTVAKKKAVEMLEKADEFFD